MLRALIELYPWDLCDEGVEAVLDRLQGEVGLTGIVLWAATPPVLQIRRRPVDPRVFRTRGGTSFHTDKYRYAATRLVPPVADWVDRENVLAKACEACAQRGLETRFVVSAEAVGGDRDLHPELATRNAFGIESRSHLCLLNPEGQGYLQTLLEELQDRFAFSCLELAGFGSRWGEAAVGNGGRFSPIGRFLFGSCWCDSCMQQAGGDGVDAESARGATVHGLDRYFGQSNLDDALIRPLLSDDGPVGRYLQWQSCRFQAWFEQLESHFSRRILLRREAMDGIADAFAHGGRIAASSSVHVLSPTWNPQESDGMDGGASEIHVPACVLEEWQADQLVARFSRLAEAGATSITAGNYGLMAPETLVGIRQAVRFARRIAS